jgi:uncharacterized membrane protein
MSYDVGTHIDLSHLNKKPEVLNVTPELFESTGTLMDVGTQFSFKVINNKFKAARRIPVAFA